MKKFVAFVLVLILLVPAAVADLPDLSGLTFEELVALRDQINLALWQSDKLLEGVLLEPGMYEVGVDIPAGNYYFEGVEGRFSTSIHVYPSITKTHALDAIQEVYNIGYGSVSQSVKSGKFILQDGWIVEIVQGPAIIHPFTGLF